MCPRKRHGQSEAAEAGEGGRRGGAHQELARMELAIVDGATCFGKMTVTTTRLSLIMTYMPLYFTD